MIDKKWMTRVIGVAVASSVIAYLVLWIGFVLATNNFDVAYALGISDALLMAISSVLIGFVVGVLTALSGKVKGRMTFIVGLIGAGIYLAVSPIAMIPVDLGFFGAVIMWAVVVTGCVLATRWAYQKAHPLRSETRDKPKIPTG